MSAQVSDESAKEEGELSDDGEVGVETEPPYSGDKTVSSAKIQDGSFHQQPAHYSPHNLNDSTQYSANRYDSQSRVYERNLDRRRFPDQRRERNENDREDGNDSGRSGFWARRKTNFPTRYGPSPRRGRKPLAAVPVPSLLSMPLQHGPTYLNLQPPPPPPPPPPPLPSSPPPTAPEPPPLVTPRYPPSSKKKQRYSPRVEEKPTQGPDDSEYIDLLLEYTQIKKQLETIKKLDAKVDAPTAPESDVSNNAPAQVNEAPPKPAKEAGELIDLTAESDTSISQPNVALKIDPNFAWSFPVSKPSQVPGNTSDQTVEHSKESHAADQSKSPAPEDEDEDEDMDILELKLAALASTVKAENKKGTKPEEKPPVFRSTPIGNRPRARRDSGRRRNSQSLSLPSTRRKAHEDHRQAEIKRRRAERKKREAERKALDDRKRREEAKRRDEERAKRDQLREKVERRRREQDSKEREERVERERFEEKRLAAKKLLTLNDPEEQYKRFMELFSDGRDHELMNKVNKNKKSPASDSQSKESPLLIDNYDQVEMDIDSDDGSSATIVVAPRQDQVLIPGLDIVNRLQAIASMPSFPPPTPEYLQPLSMPYGENWGATPLQTQEEPAIPGLDLIYRIDDPMDLEENEGLETIHDEPPPALMQDEYDLTPAQAQPAINHYPMELQTDALPAPKEEDEEGKLRAKLLQSLMRRRQEKADMEVRSSASSSPNPEREYVPTKLSDLKASTPPYVPPKKKPSHQNMRREFPRHARVVVTLGADSDDSDEEVKQQETPMMPFGMPGSLDLFLKQARQSVEAKQTHTDNKSQRQSSRVVHESKPGDARRTVLKTSGTNSGKNSPTKSNKEKKAELQKILREKVAQLETALKKERNEVVKETKTMETTSQQISRKRNNLRQSEVKVQKLREQIAAADRVVKANQTQLIKYEQKARDTRAKIEEKNRRISAIEKQLVVAGQRAFGGKTDSRKIKPNQAGDMKITIANLKDQNVDPKVIAEEKARLQAQEKRLLQMIRAVKEQTNDVTTSLTVPSVTMETEYAYEQPEVEHIQTEERMSFSFGPEVETEVTAVEPKRRKSLVDIHTGTKPNLPVKQDKDLQKSNGNKAVQGQASDKALESEAKDAEKKLKLPTGQRLANLSKLHIESMSKLHQECDTKDVVLPFPHKDIKPFKQSKLENSVKSKGVQSRGDTDVSTYTTPLRRFRSYRFSPYYRNKNGFNLNSVSYSNKLNPEKVLCRFDLTGKCNDTDCPWQHKSDYELSEGEVLSDLVSYHPGIAGVNSKGSNPEQINGDVDKYVIKFQKQTEKMSHDERCIFLTSLVNQSAKHVPPYTIFEDKRRWKLEPPEKKQKPQITNDRREKHHAIVDLPQAQVNKIDEDNIISEGDVRYWMLATEEVGDMESAVIENPRNIDMWIKLAYKKLTDKQTNGSNSIDNALNVLSRGLEANKNSQELWLHYLSLYSKRDNPQELLELCKQAAQFAPSYELYWMYLEIVRKCSQKNKLCKRILIFLGSSQCKKMTKEKRSHCFLEILLYQASLYLSIGKYKSAVLILQTPLKSKETVYQNMMLLMTREDKVLLWISYLHLLEFRKLPEALYDAGNGNPGKIVRKDDICLSWQGRKSTKLAPEKLRELIEEAIISIYPEGLDSKSSFPFIKSLAELELVCQQPDAAINAHRRLLARDPRFVDCWIAIANIHYHNGDLENTRKVLKDEAIKCCPLSSRLYFHTIMFLLSQGDEDAALDLGEDSAINLYDVDVQSKSCDPQLLYCKLLRQALPLDYKPPDHKPELTPQVIEEQYAYIWLCYCLLSELQGYADWQVSETYETALSSLHRTKDLKLVWLRFLQYKYNIAETTQSQESYRRYADLVHRCLISMPSKFLLPLSTNKYWLDFRFHNQILDFYTGTLPEESVLPALEKYASKMTHNVALVTRACQMACRRGDLVLAKGFCLTALYENPKALLLWKMRLYCAHKGGKARELRKLFKKATKNLPYSLSLWKDFLLFEVTHGSPDEVKSVLDQCAEIEMSIHEFKDAILK